MQIKIFRDPISSGKNKKKYNYTGIVLLSTTNLIYNIYLEITANRFYKERIRPAEYPVRK